MKIIFWIDKGVDGKYFHADLFREVKIELKPDEVYKKMQPEIYIFGGQSKTITEVIKTKNDILKGANIYFTYITL